MLAHAQPAPGLKVDTLLKDFIDWDVMSSAGSARASAAPRFLIHDVGLMEDRATCRILDSTAFQAARALIFEGEAQPSGYTEPVLHNYRLKLKAGPR